MKNNLVIKANKLNESRYKLSIQEQRIVLTMISMIKPGDNDFKPYSFTVREFAELTGIKGNSPYSELKKVTKTLLSKTFTITEPSGDLQIGWVSSVKYFKQNGRVKISFDPLLKPYLLALKKEFTRYQLKNTIRLKSIYSVRLYELLKQYQGVGFRDFDLKELRNLLDIPDTKLTPYANFKMRVLEKAKSEMKNTDLIFVYKPIKTGRRVTGLHFTIRQNNPIIKNSYKKKEKKKKIFETQGVFDLQRKKEQTERAKINEKLDILKDFHPELYKKLEKQAKKRIPKKKLHAPGFKTTIRLKMGVYLPKFMENFEIDL